MYREGSKDLHSFVKQTVYHEKTPENTIFNFRKFVEYWLMDWNCVDQGWIVDFHPLSQKASPGLCTSFRKNIFVTIYVELYAQQAYCTSM